MPGFAEKTRDRGTGHCKVCGKIAKVVRPTVTHCESCGTVTVSGAGASLTVPVSNP